MHAHTHARAHTGCLLIDLLQLVYSNTDANRSWSGGLITGVSLLWRGLQTTRDQTVGSPALRGRRLTPPGLLYISPATALPPISPERNGRGSQAFSPGRWLYAAVTAPLCDRPRDLGRVSVKTGLQTREITEF